MISYNCYAIFKRFSKIILSKKKIKRTHVKVSRICKDTHHAMMLMHDITLRLPLARQRILPVWPRKIHRSLRGHHWPLAADQ